MTFTFVKPGDFYIVTFMLTGQAWVTGVFGRRVR